jgi:hypothetical protein
MLDRKSNHIHSQKYPILNRLLDVTAASLIVTAQYRMSRSLQGRMAFVMYLRVNFYVLTAGEHAVFVSGNVHGEAVKYGWAL